MFMFAFFVGNFVFFKACCFTFQLNHVFQLDENGKPTVFVKEILTPQGKKKCTNHILESGV